MLSGLAKESLNSNNINYICKKLKQSKIYDQSMGINLINPIFRGENTIPVLVWHIF